MKKIILWTVGIGVVIVALLILAPIPVVPFQPVLHDGTGDHNFIPRDIRTPAEADAVVAVLKKYDDPHLKFGKTVLVPVSLARQADLRWNYTGKAGLGVWLHEAPNKVLEGTSL